MKNPGFDAFLGPKGENGELFKELILKVIDNHLDWRKNFFPSDKSLYESKPSNHGEFQEILDEFLKLHNTNLPYFHPRYSAQMLKDPSIFTLIGYLAFMMSNPNNHAYEGGPVTTLMELEVTDMMLKMCGFDDGWGHLASGGSLANTEALWAVRDTRNEGAVYFSEVSHYSWKRICTILRIPGFKEIEVDGFCRMDLNHLEDNLKINNAMMVIANLGSTGSGSIDDIEGLLKLKEKYGFHLHIDAAYGGFSRSVFLDKNNNVLPYSQEFGLSEYAYRQLIAIKDADSLTIDPHKQGLISYGAGAVIYKDQKLREPLSNTAPYTYHKTDKPNIGMFSLEGSRPGAMAAACWLTYKYLPLNNVGTGKIISGSLKTAKKFYELVDKSSNLSNFLYPDLDINTFYNGKKIDSVDNLNRLALQIYNNYSIENPEAQFIVSKFVMPANIIKKRFPFIMNNDYNNATVLRSVFIKHWGEVNDYYYTRLLVEELDRFAISKK